MDPMLTVAQRLRSAGFEEDLSAAPGARLRCSGCGQIDHAHAVIVEEIARFEGDSNPDDEGILVAAELSCGHHGLFSAGYGPSADIASADVLRALPRPSSRGERLSETGPARQAKGIDEGGDPACWAHLSVGSSEQHPSGG